MLTLSERALNIVPSATVGLSDRIAALQARDISVLKLNIGEPDFAPPENVCRAAVEAVEARFSKYTAAAGILELRQAICDKLLKDNQVRYAPSEICVSTGAKQALQNALMALCSPGDEVILPTPGWVSYSEMIKIAGGVPVFVPFREEDGFDLDLAAIERALTPRTKAILICTPHNPTGAVYSEERLRALAAMALEHQFYILSDEIYEKLLFEGRHFSVASVSEAVRKITVTVNGFSKAFAMPGWRLGYTAAAEPVASAIRDLQGHMTSAPNSIAQKAGAEALRGPQESVELMRREYERRRDFVCEALSTMPGVRLLKPHGAFYVFPNVEGLFGTRCGSRVIGDAKDLAEYLIEEARVAVVFGDAFFMPGYIRVAYTISMDDLREAMRRMAEAVARLER